MRRLIITTPDGTFDADIDNNTAIGIDIQTYDIKQPGKRKINISNQFTIPSTAKNMKIFGFPGNIASISLTPYADNYADYWVDNVQLIKNSRCKIQEVTSERITLLCFEKSTIWDELKAYLWKDFIYDFLMWMKTEKGLPVSMGASGTWTYFSGTLGELVDIYKDTTEGVVLAHYVGNLGDYYRVGYTHPLETQYTITLFIHELVEDRPDPEPDLITFGEGGHFSIYIKTIFEFLSFKYSTDFFTDGGSFAGNIWDDEFIKRVYTPARDICIEGDPGGTSWSFFKKNYVDELPGPIYVERPGTFAPLDDVKDKNDKSMYDFVLSVFQHFNIIVKEVDEGIKLRRFDDIEIYGNIVDWSGITGKPVFKPYVDGYGKHSYIKFKEIYPEGDKLLNSKDIQCNNMGLEEQTDLFEIDAYVPTFTSQSIVPVLNVKESFKTFQFFAHGDIGVFQIYIRMWSRSTYDEWNTSKYLYPAQLVSLDAEYQLVERALEYPKYYEIDKWIKLSDIVNFDDYCFYYFKELNGAFFINKISGFNPQKSNAPTKLELFWISDKQPPPTFVTDFYTDGTGDEFSDGEGDYYY